MANDYKKRLKGNWCQGKRYKGDDAEREYAKKEISEGIKSIDEGYLTKHKGKRKKNVQARLQYWVDWYSKRVEQAELNKDKSMSSWYWREGLAKSKKALKEFLEKEK